MVAAAIGLRRMWRQHNDYPLSPAEIRNGVDRIASRFDLQTHTQGIVPETEKAYGTQLRMARGRIVRLDRLTPASNPWFRASRGEIKDEALNVAASCTG
jgi:hypothetical protein